MVYQGTTFNGFKTSCLLSGVLRDCKKTKSQTFKRSAFRKALADLNVLEDLVEKCTLTKSKISLKRENQQSVSNQSTIIKSLTPLDIFISTVTPNFTKSNTPLCVFSRFLDCTNVKVSQISFMWRLSFRKVKLDQSS